TREHRRQRALGERAVADLTPAGAAHEADFADREGREVVVEHETLPLFALEALDLLRIVGGPERARDERLRLAAREDGRAVRPRQHAGLDLDRAHLVELAAVEAHAVRQHFLAQDLFLQLLEDRLRVGLALDLALGNRRDEILERLLDALVVLQLAADPHRLGERHEHFLFDLAVEVVADLLVDDLHLRPARLLRQIVDRSDDLPDRRVRRLQRFDDLLFGHFLRAGLDHHQAVLAAGDDEVELAGLALLERRVDDELPVDEADADAG